MMSSKRKQQKELELLRALAAALDRWEVSLAKEGAGYGGQGDTGKALDAWRKFRDSAVIT